MLYTHEQKYIASREGKYRKGKYVNAGFYYYVVKASEIRACFRNSKSFFVKPDVKKEHWEGSSILVWENSSSQC